MCATRKKEKERESAEERVRRLQTTETWAVSEMRTSEDQQDGDSTGGMRWEEEEEGVKEKV